MAEQHVLFPNLRFHQTRVRITSIPLGEDPFINIPPSVCEELIGLELDATFWSGPQNEFFRITDKRKVMWAIICSKITEKLGEKNSTLALTSAIEWWEKCVKRINSPILVFSEENCEVISN
jgi:hypothetical protein